MTRATFQFTDGTARHKNPCAAYALALLFRACSSHSVA